MFQNSCEFCKNPLNGGKKFCSYTCRGEYQKANRPWCECETCGKSFQIRSVYILKRGRGKFCSPKCRTDAKKVTLLDRVCENCGANFQIKPIVLTQGENRGLFCSVECRCLGMNAKQTPRTTNPNNWEFRDCAECGKSFECLVKSPRKYCSKKCYGNEVKILDINVVIELCEQRLSIGQIAERLDCCKDLVSDAIRDAGYRKERADGPPKKDPCNKRIVGEEKFVNNAWYVWTGEELIRKHILIMETHLGRKLHTGEHVEFIDQNRNNFQFSNLLLTNEADNFVYTTCPKCEESRFLTRTAYELRKTNFCRHCVGSTIKKNIPKGEDSPKTILTNEQVIEMRRLYDDEGFSTVELSKIFPATRHTIYRIIHRDNWKHLP